MIYKTSEDIEAAKFLLSPPGDTLLETIESIGLSQKELASRMGRPIKTINEIIQGKTAILPETAIQLER
jgi:HTH-type transcriptional regulator/antitoxin HigA